MATPMRDLYDGLEGASTADQRRLCESLLTGLESAPEAPNIAALFAASLAGNAAFDNVGQPFLNEPSLRGRKPLGPDSRGDNRIVHLLASGGGEVAVRGGPADYRFTYVNRQLPPLRQERAGVPTSGAGGIDYTARTATRPVLGEVKRGDDQNPFYAFVQLLTYLSEMATERQVARANRHGEFGRPLAFPQPFDLHILLADFNDRGEKGPLIDLTWRLAAAFMNRLTSHHGDAAPVVGTILCLRMDSADFIGRSVECLWHV